MSGSGEEGGAVTMLGGTRPAERASRAPVRLEVRSRQRWQTRYLLLVLAVDVAVLLTSAEAAAWIRFRDDSTVVGTSGLAYDDFGRLVALLWLGVLTLGRAYEHRFLGNGAEEYRRVLDASVRFLAVFGVGAYLLRLDAARGFLSILFAVAVVGLLAGRFACRQVLRALRRRGRCLHRVVVVGRPTQVDRLVARMLADLGCGLLPVAACSDEDGVLEVPVLGRTSDVVSALAEAGADTLAVAAGNALDSDDLERLAHSLEGTGVDLLVQPRLTSVFRTRISERPVAGLPMLHVEEPELTGARRVVKSAFDHLVGALLLLLVLPVVLLAALAVRLTSRGPAFFRQVRVGRAGEPFTCFKLRTMYVDAEARRAALLEHNRHGSDGVLFKLDADPRITPVGRILRRYSVDEVPQLLNVVLGQMSLVGPRPPLPEEVARYDGPVHRRLLVKPGMTGLWQVSGRSDLSWEESVALDLRYVENWSFGADLLLLARTVVAVVRPRGAY